MILEDDLKITVEKDDVFNTVNNLFTHYEDFTICNLAYNHIGEKGEDRKLKHNFYNYENIQTKTEEIPGHHFDYNQ